MIVERIIRVLERERESERENKRETQIKLVLLKKSQVLFYIEKEKEHSRKNATNKTAITNIITNLIQHSHHPPPANSRWMIINRKSNHIDCPQTNMKRAS